MKIPFIALLFQTIPESIAIVTLTFALTKLKTDWKKILFIGVILALTVFFIRMLPITMGIHTIVSLGILIVLMSVLTDADTTALITSCILSFVLLLILEISVYNLFNRFFGLSIGEILSDKFLRIVAAYPHIIIIFLLSYVVKRR